MRTPNNSTAGFMPGNPPDDPAQIQRYLQDLEQRLLAAFLLLASSSLPKTTVAPTKPRDGMLRYADGTSWNPGGGKGVYLHNGSIWTLIKAIP